MTIMREGIAVWISRTCQRCRVQNTENGIDYTFMCNTSSLRVTGNFFKRKRESTFLKCRATLSPLVLRNRRMPNLNGVLTGSSFDSPLRNVVEHQTLNFTVSVRRQD